MHRDVSSEFDHELNLTDTFSKNYRRLDSSIHCSILSDPSYQPFA